MAAAVKGNATIVQALLDHGADLTIENNVLEIKFI